MIKAVLAGDVGPMIMVLARVAGLTLAMAILFPGTRAQAASYAPIDCTKASAPSETAICHNYALGQAEARVATLFGIVTSLVGMGQRDDIGDRQRQWIKTRDACGADAGCLAGAYRVRIDALSEILDSIVARGPF